MCIYINRRRKVARSFTSLGSTAKTYGSPLRVKGATGLESRARVKVTVARQGLNGWCFEARGNSLSSPLYLMVTS